MHSLLQHKFCTNFCAQMDFFVWKRKKLVCTKISTNKVCGSIICVQNNVSSYLSNVANLGCWYIKLTDKAVLNRNDAFSILVVSTKKRYSSFLRKVFIFQKIWIKVNVLKTFKTLTDCHIKTCRSLKRSAILKISSTVF